MRIAGSTYRTNDLIALSRDLEIIENHGFRVIKLSTLIADRARFAETVNGKFVALTCDDGGDFDFYDLPHPAYGTQRSVMNRIVDFRSKHPDSSAHITSFVIVSPEARVELDRTCMVGKSWWTDSWWRRAISSGLMEIGNHSWDHNHDSLTGPSYSGSRRGTFCVISTKELADLQIRKSSEWLHQSAPNPGAFLFAYPYGESNAYLRDTYLPTYGRELGVAAAFGTDAKYFDGESSVWNIPRFVCGRDWSDPAGLEAILDGAESAV